MAERKEESYGRRRKTDIFPLARELFRNFFFHPVNGNKLVIVYGVLMYLINYLITIQKVYVVLDDCHTQNRLETCLTIIGN